MVYIKRNGIVLSAIIEGLMFKNLYFMYGFRHCGLVTNELLLLYLLFCQLTQIGLTISGVDHIVNLQTLN
jgi:hypothetical protein